VLSTEIVKPAGWTWQPTGEKFADWWDRQDTTARNVGLRSTNIRLDFEYTPGADTPRMNLDLGDLFELTQQMNASGPVVEWQEVLNAMHDNGCRSRDQRRKHSPHTAGSLRRGGARLGFAYLSALATRRARPSRSAFQS
jgi:site-specific DNA recombinase